MVGTRVWRQCAVAAAGRMNADKGTGCARPLFMSPEYINSAAAAAAAG